MNAETSLPAPQSIFQDILVILNSDVKMDGQLKCFALRGQWFRRGAAGEEEDIVPPPLFPCRGARTRVDENSWLHPCYSLQVTIPTPRILPIPVPLATNFRATFTRFFYFYNAQMFKKSSKKFFQLNSARNLRKDMSYDEADLQSRISSRPAFSRNSTNYSSGPLRKPINPNFTQSNPIFQNPDIGHSKQ